MGKAISFESAKYYYKDMIFTTNEGYKIKVLEYFNKNNVLIEFLESGYRKTVQMGNILSGSIKYPFKRNKYGGFYGDGPYTKRRLLKYIIHG